VADDRAVDLTAGDEDPIDELARLRVGITEQVGRVIVGQQRVIEDLLIGLFAQGHCLFIGVPGLGKTLLVHTVARAMDLDFSRVQFTPDLMPSDITGTDILDADPETGERCYRFVPGPIFANVLLSDEINRAPPKTQSALLQAMQERQVTAGGRTYDLPDPFFVLATQNPIEQEGTYPLPEAQVDRFMLKVKITYPQRDEERKVLDLALDGTSRPIQPVLGPDEVLRMQEVVRMIYIDDQVKNYILDVVGCTRDPEKFGRKNLAPLIDYGASPRASIYLGLGARAIAFLAGRGYVTPQDVKDVAYDVLRHRIILTYEAEAEETTPENVIETILSTVPVP